MMKMMKDNPLCCVSASEEISPVISGKRPRKQPLNLFFMRSIKKRSLAVEYLCAFMVDLMKLQFAWRKERMSRAA